MKEQKTNKQTNKEKTGIFLIKIKPLSSGIAAE